MQLSKSEYIEELIKRYQLHYNIETNKYISGTHVDIYALSIIEHFRSILNKKFQIDKFQEREIILVKGFDNIIEEKDMIFFTRFLIDSINEIINPSTDIMSHTIDGIMISSQGTSEKAITLLQKFKYSKTFLWGIKGWCDIRLLLIDIKSKSVFCNCKGREIINIYSFKDERGEE